MFSLVIVYRVFAFELTLGGTVIRVANKPLGILPDWPPGEDDQFYLPIQVLRSNGPWLPAEWTIIGVWRMCRFMMERHDQQRVHYYSQGELVTRSPNLIPKEHNIHGRRTTAMDREAVCVRFAYESNNGWGTHLPNYNRPVGPNANMMDVLGSPSPLQPFRRK